MADCTEGAQSRVLLYTGKTTEVADGHRLSKVGARDRFESIDDLLIALESPSRHD
jgi:hypothetical protein